MFNALQMLFFSFMLLLQLFIFDLIANLTVCVFVLITECGHRVFIFSDTVFFYDLFGIA